MALTPEQSNAIYKHIIITITEGLDSGELEAWEASEIAEYVLGRVDKLESENDKYKFYEELSALWPFLEVLLEEHAAEMIEKTEGEISEGALALLQHGKVEDALNLVKTATNPK